MICNDEIVSSLDKGPLLLEEKQCEVATTKRYKSAAGKVKFCGTGALKSTQLLGKKRLWFISSSVGVCRFLV